jgi:hypothetical protein
MHSGDPSILNLNLFERFCSKVILPHLNVGEFRWWGKLSIFEQTISDSVVHISRRPYTVSLKGVRALWDPGQASRNPFPGS